MRLVTKSAHCCARHNGSDPRAHTQTNTSRLTPSAHTYTRTHTTNTCTLAHASWLVLPPQTSTRYGARIGDVIIDCIHGPGAVQRAVVQRARTLPQITDNHPRRALSVSSFFRQITRCAHLQGVRRRTARARACIYGVCVSPRFILSGVTGTRAWDSRARAFIRARVARAPRAHTRR